MALKTIFNQMSSSFCGNSRIVETVFQQAVFVFLIPPKCPKLAFWGVTDICMKIGPFHFHFHHLVELSCYQQTILCHRAFSEWAYQGATDGWGSRRCEAWGGDCQGVTFTLEDRNWMFIGSERNSQAIPLYLPDSCSRLDLNLGTWPGFAQT